MEISDILGFPQDLKSYELLPEVFVLPRQNIGLEFEVENVTSKYLKAFRASKFAHLWQDTEDGSLRGGREFTSNGPLFGKDLYTSIDVFLDLAKKYGFRISERTGLHVHLDISNLSADVELPMFCCLYALFERPLFTFSGWHRTQNNNCVPWFLADDHLEDVCKLFRTSDKREFKNIIHGLERYSALNLNSMDTYPTVEFRHMEMTFDKSEILTWINLIMALKKGTQTLAKMIPYPHLITFLSTHGVERLGEIVFGEVFPSIQTPDLNSLVWENLLLLEDLIVLYNNPKNVWEVSPIGVNSKKDTLMNRFLQKHPI